MSHFRRNLLAAGIGGLLASLLLAAGSLWVVKFGILSPPLPYRSVAWLLSVILGAISLAEIPVMIFTMRRLSTERTENHRLVAGLNALYTFFAAVYGVPVSLVTGNVGLGLALCTLSVVRFVTSLAFVQDPVL